MIWVAIEKQYDEEVKKYAGGKARQDLETILLKCGIREKQIVAPQIERMSANLISKIFYHIIIEKIWENTIKDLDNGDAIILQFPVINHTLLFSRFIKKTKRRGIKLYAFIHDLDLIRYAHLQTQKQRTRLRIKLEESNEIKKFDGIVVHNEIMKNYMHTKLKIATQKLVVLGIFDYLLPDGFTFVPYTGEKDSCLIAGNLDKSKSSYIYNLPLSPVFELFGSNFAGSKKTNVNYHGSFVADELPYHLRGGFGLVWDGDSIETCNGVTGQYLKYNNPHKTSLYLACGIPVIIWEEAALAKYVIDNTVGITIRSLNELSDRISNISEDEYKRMKNNAERIAQDLRSGKNTKKALAKLLDL